ncbi:MAG: MBL fold metallo-hydrolase [Clostridia bacterium]|nr:MBL fold metallo-hydrolase [Clostridia bacterium]
MRITSLIENTTENEKLTAEHGLSLYIETEQHKILFDMGQSEKFADNAEKLGIDLTEVDIAILSHGHYDHGGGIRRFLEINKKSPIYINQYAFEEHYNSEKKYIGLDTSLIGSDRFIFTEDFRKIDCCLTLCTCNNNNRPFNVGDFGMLVKSEDIFSPEDFKHEQYLLIEEGGNNVLISGCSHKGIMNITDWFKPDILVGGFHFSKFPLNEKLEEYAKILASFATTYYTCHCTGTEQYNFMKNYLPNLYYLSTGKEIII